MNVVFSFTPQQLWFECGKRWFSAKSFPLHLEMAVEKKASLAAEKFVLAVEKKAT